MVHFQDQNCTVKLKLGKRVDQTIIQYLLVTNTLGPPLGVQIFAAESAEHVKVRAVPTVILNEAILERRGKLKTQFSTLTSMRRLEGVKPL